MINPWTIIAEHKGASDMLALMIKVMRRIYNDDYSFASINLSENPLNANCHTLISECSDI